MKRRNAFRGNGSRMLRRSGKAMGRPAADDGFGMMEHFEPRVLLAAVFWDGGAGTSNWNDAANWNRAGADALPMNGDDVTISVAANPTIVFSTGSVTLNSLLTDENLTVTGGTLGVSGIADINAVMLVNGGTIQGGTWDVSGGSMHAGGSGGTFDNTIVQGDILLDVTSARARFIGATRFTAARLQANAATVQFAPGYVLHDEVISEGAPSGARTIQAAVGGAGTLTIAPTGVIRMAAGVGGALSLNNSSAATVINNGLISAEADGRIFSINTSDLTNNALMQALAGTLTISPTTWANAGSVTAANATLSLEGAWAGAGTITATNSTVNLGGTFNTLAAAQLSRTGGTVNLVGTLDNIGSTLTLNAASGDWVMLNGEINGGTVDFVGANRLLMTSSGGILTDVNFLDDLLFDTTSARVRVSGTTRATAFRLQANNANLQCSPGYILQDLVVAEGITGGARTLQGGVGGAGTLTIAPSGVVRLAAGSGANLTVSNSSITTLINNGLISAEADTRTLTINCSELINNAAMQALAGTLNVSPTTWTNFGTVTATNATVSIGGAWSGTGSITSTNGTLNLGGTFDAVGIAQLSRTGGTVNLTGTLNNTGNTLTLNSTTGDWNLLGGNINGGSLDFVGANRLVPTTSAGDLIDVTVLDDILIDSSSARVRIGGTTRFPALRLQASSALAQFTPGYVLMDLVVAEGAATGARSIQGAVGGTGTLTIAPSGVIRLAPGAGGNLSISNSSILSLINNGLISAEADSRTLSINNTELTNNATMQALAGTLNISPTTWNNPGTVTATNATVTLDGAWTGTGVITAVNSTVNLAGTFNAVGVAQLSRTAGTVNLTGTMDNTGNTLTFNAASGDWNLLGGTISAGTIDFVGSNRLVMTTSGGTLINTTVLDDLLLDTSSARVKVDGSTRFTAVRLQANNANLQTAPGYVLQDLVVAEGVNAGTRTIQAATGGSGPLTIGATGVIRLAAVSGGNLNLSNSSVATIINNGLISAEADSRTLLFNNSVFTNNGTVQVLAGTINISPVTWTNEPAGLITATNATLRFEGAWSNAGTVSITNATLNLAGTFSTPGLGTINRAGGTVALIGTLDNSGSTLSFTPATGSWDIVSGTINGGNVVFGAERLNFTSSVGTLIDVQVSGEILLNNISSRVKVGGSTRFTAIRLSDNNTNVQFVTDYVLHDLIIAEGPAVGGRVLTGAVGGTGSLTISPTGVIRLAPESGAGLSISNSSQTSVINNGLISAEAAGHSLTINTTSFTNNATVQVSNGTLDIRSSEITNITPGVLTGGAWLASGPGVLSLPAKTVIITNNADVGVGGPASFPALATLAINNGSLTASGGGTFTITPKGGTLLNNGVITLAPTSTLAVSGAFTQDPNAQVVVQIQGTTPADIGRMTVSGAATLDGNLTVNTVNGYDPDCVNSVFLSAGSLVGEFATYSLPTPPPSFQTLVVYINGEVRFAISPPSDFNRDGILNSQDFFDFLTAFFQQDELSDFNDDGIINSQDFFDFITDFFNNCQ